MKKTLYHGSKDIIDSPVYGKGYFRNDYGLGFYCTENLELALEWAVDNNRDGYANEYEIELNGLKILNLNDKKYNILHWLTILLKNRVINIKGEIANYAKDYLIENFSISYEEYDVIIGYRADDSYFTFAKDFLNNTISYEKLSRVMKLGNLGEQFVLMSEKAFKQINFIKSHFADSKVYFEKKTDRDTTARNEYLHSRKNRRIKGELYMNIILDEEIKDGDPRL